MIYYANLSQSNTNVPTENWKKSSFKFPFTFVRNTTGSYTIQSSEFTSRTIVLATCGTGFGGNGYMVQAARLSTGDILLSIYNSSGGSTDNWNNLQIKIQTV